MSLTLLISRTVIHESIVVSNLISNSTINKLSSIHWYFVVVMIYCVPLREVFEVTSLSSIILKHFYNWSMKTCISHFLIRFSTMSSREPDKLIFSRELPWENVTILRTGQICNQNYQWRTAVHQNYLQHDFVFFPSNIDSLPWYSLASQSSRLCQDPMLGKLKLIDWSTVYLKVASVRFSEVKSVLQIFKLLPDSLYILSIIINATHLGLKDRIMKIMKLWSEPGELHEILRQETFNLETWTWNNSIKKYSQWWGKISKSWKNIDLYFTVLSSSNF